MNPFKILLILLLFAISSCSGYQSFEPWTTREKVTGTYYLATSWVDYQQTRNIASRKDARELNPHLGEDPSNEEIAQYFITTRIALFAVAHFLDHEDRMFWLAFWSGASSATIYWNYRMGF